MPDKKRDQTTVQVAVDRELHREAKAAAALQGRTLADVVRDAFAALVSQGKTKRKS